MEVGETHRSLFQRGLDGALILQRDGSRDVAPRGHGAGLGRLGLQLQMVDLQGAAALREFQNGTIKGSLTVGRHLIRRRSGIGCSQQVLNARPLHIAKAELGVQRVSAAELSVSRGLQCGAGEVGVQAEGHVLAGGLRIQVQAAHLLAIGREIGGRHFAVEAGQQDARCARGPRAGSGRAHFGRSIGIDLHHAGQSRPRALNIARFGEVDVSPGDAEL